MSIQKQFETTMRSFGLVPGGAPIFLAISGGVDSVVLGHLLKSAGYEVTWLHMNFQLRGEESERDQRFVENLAGEWGVKVQVSRVDAATYANSNKCSIQEAARILRYEWFSEIVQAAGKQAVLLTAHHADDNAETLLMYFLRGTGLKGLTGIPAVNDRIRRPLLEISRASIESYAKENYLSFVEDSSNRSTDYTRNKLRLEVLPLLRTLYPQVDQNLHHNLERFRGAYFIYRQAVERWLRKYVRVDGVEQRVSVALLLKPENRAMVHEWLSPHGFTEKQEMELIRLGESTSGHFLVSADGKFRVIRHRKHFILAPISQAGVEEQWVGAGVSEVYYLGGKLQFAQLNSSSVKISDAAQVAFLDASTLEFPLLLRKWRAGDYFYPLGLNKKKKLARFLIDQKLSAIDKEKVWVLESGQRIIWVVGQRIDHRFRLTEASQKLLRIELLPPS